MLRFHPIADAKEAASYYSKSDGGYYLGDRDLHCEWGGKAAEMLGLSGRPDYEHFTNLIHGLDPHTGEQLTAKLIDNRVPGWDITASVPKGVTVALERGDSRIQQAIWDAARETMSEIEAAATTRVRAGGKQDDRTTGNVVWYAVEHPETRPSKADQMPDPDRHIHFVVMNVTYDQAEQQWKAVKFRPVMDDRKWFDRRFDSRLASKLTDLGYSIETKWKADDRGGKRYFSWDIDGIPDSVVTKFSRRAQEVEQLADELGVRSAMGKDKLGATSREFKRKDMTLADYREYWNGRVTERESQEIAETIKAAMLGQNERPEQGAAKAMAYAIDHHFERQAVVPVKQLEITGMERSMGSARPEDIERAGKRLGLLVKDGEATTQQVLEQEGRIIAFARGGRGTMRPLGLSANNAIFEKPTESHVTGLTSAQGLTANGRSEQTEIATLSPEQQAVCRHVWDSPDRVIMIEGDAGVGKTHTMKAAVAGVDKPVVVLAPSADASRGVLRRDFPEADTVASFLGSPEAQAKARNGVIWIDESGQLSMNQIDQVFGVAEHVGARVVLQGDRKQHASVERGHIMHVLEEHAGLPVARLQEIRRQTHGDYKQAVASIAKGDILAGYDILDGLGWVRETPVFDHNKPLVDDYLAAVEKGKSALVVAPTHAEGDEITSEIRARLKEKGALGNDDKIFQVLKPLHLSEAQKADHHHYDGSEVIQFHRNSGSHRAGDRVTADHWLHAENAGQPKHFSVYRSETVGLSVGDSIRITGNGWDSTRKHRIDNGSMYTVAGFTKDGDIELNNGWVVGKDFGHLAHGYVTTSHASQGKTVDAVLIAMGHESAPAINAEQFYVSVSRGRERATIYSDLSAPVLRDAIQRATKPKTATDLIGQPQKPEPSGWQFVQRVQRYYDQLREKAREFIQEWTQQREPEYVR